MKPHRIAVLGAGIGGLAAARFLQADGHDVTLIERFDTPRPLGSGLMIQPVGLAVLDALGLQARTLGSPITRMFGMSGKRVALNVAYRAHAPGLGIHRGALFQLLWQNSGLSVVTGAKVMSAPYAEGQRSILCEDGTRLGPYDLVVDASGAQSAVSPLKSRALPFGAIWAHTPWPVSSPLPKDRLNQAYWRASRMAGVLPCGHLPNDPTPLAAIFWSMPRQDLDNWHRMDFARWRDDATAFWPEFAPFVQNLSQGDFSIARYSHGTLRHPYSRALAHIGDAAHRASPQLGQGANMALLDAFALAQALRRHADLQEALATYASTRRTHLRTYQSLSRLLTPMFQSSSVAIPWLRDICLAPAARLWPMPGLLTALVSGDLVNPIRN